MTVMGVWTFLVGSRLGRAVAAVVAAVLLVLGLRKMWKAEGARDAEQEAKDADLDKAERVRRAVDDWRADDGFVRPDDERGYRD